MIRLIGIDMDGTLLDSQGRMPEANRRAVCEAVEQGIHVALVTGRSYPFARPIADGLPSSISLIVSNGAIERAMDGDTLARRLLDKDVARGILRRTRASRHAAALIFDRDRERQMVFETMDWEHPGRRGYFARNRSLIARAVSLEDALDEDPIQVMFNGGVDEMRSLAADVRGLDADVAVSVTEYVARDFTLVDVTSPGATKGHALAWRAAQLEIAADEVMAVGDNFNDLGMLRFAGVPVVMGNAVAALKVYGWYVTGHQDESGLAQAIRELALDGTHDTNE